MTLSVFLEYLHDNGCLLGIATLLISITLWALTLDRKERHVSTVILIGICTLAVLSTLVRLETPGQIFRLTKNSAPRCGWDVHIQRIHQLRRQLPIFPWQHKIHIQEYGIFLGDPFGWQHSGMNLFSPQTKETSIVIVNADLSMLHRLAEPLGYCAPGCLLDRDRWCVSASLLSYIYRAFTPFP